MLNNIRRKILTMPESLHNKILLSLCKYLPNIEDLKFSKLRLGMMCKNSFRYFGQLSSFPISICEVNGITFNMIECSANVYIMGHVEQKGNEPHPEIIERSFLLGETEVTQELYLSIMGENPSSNQASNKSKSGQSLYPFTLQHPVEKVSWYDAILFCNKLSVLQGLDECYILTNISTKDTEGNEQGRVMSAEVACAFDKNGYRLPTEKEWEYAAKAGTDDRWVGTDNEDFLQDYNIFDKNSGLQTYPVKSKLPNAWGFYDMGGNVKEWCWDEIMTNFTKTGNRKTKGGHFKADKDLLKTSLWIYDRPSTRVFTLGFRVCRNFVN